MTSSAIASTAERFMIPLLAAGSKEPGPTDRNPGAYKYDSSPEIAL